jgi:hypothetical protein
MQIVLGLTAAGLVLPGPSLAAQSAEGTNGMYLISLGLGAAGTLLTMLATSRFIMSW